MAEFCLRCFNELNEKNYTEKDVWLEDDFCEGCAEWKPCVIALHRKPLYLRLFDCIKFIGKKRD